jgi:hypothetical protein
MVTALDHMTRRGFLSREDGSWRLNVGTREIDLEVPESLLESSECRSPA